MGLWASQSDAGRRGRSRGKRERAGKEHPLVGILDTVHERSTEMRDLASDAV